jgi:hypothetical protein
MLRCRGVGKEMVLGQFEKRVKNATSDTQRAHAQSGSDALTGIFEVGDASVLGLPDHPPVYGVAGLNV